MSCWTLCTIFLPLTISGLVYALHCFADCLQMVGFTTSTACHTISAALHLQVPCTPIFVVLLSFSSYFHHPWTAYYCHASPCLFSPSQTLLHLLYCPALLFVPSVPPLSEPTSIFANCCSHWHLLMLLISYNLFCHVSLT